MKTVFIIIVSYLFISTSCRKEEIPNTETDENGVVLSMPFNWKASLHDGTPQSNSYFKVPIQHDNGIAIPTTDSDGKRYISMINSNNGSLLWKWSDIESVNTDYIDISYIYKNDNLMTYQFGSWSICLDLDNGTTHWKTKRISSFHVTISGLENTYFTLGESETMYPDYEELVAYKGNIETGEIEEFIIPNFTLEHIIGSRIGDVTRVEPCFFNETQYLAVIWQELTDDVLWNFQSYLGLYNYETNEWVYEKEIMNEPNLNGVILASPVIYNNKIYANIGHELVCHNLTTGEQIWNKQFTQDFMFSGFIIEEDKIIANNENLTLYCLDPETGGEIWTGEGAGTSSRMSYLNGIVYFVGGSDSRFHAVDVETGQTVWRLNAEKLEGYDGMFKTNAVYVIPGENGKKGKVIALTHMNAYCFEAYR